MKKLELTLEMILNHSDVVTILCAIETIIDDLEKMIEEEDSGIKISYLIGQAEALESLKRSIINAFSDDEDEDEDEDEEHE